MKVNPPSTLNGNDAKSEAISKPYLYLEKLPNENAFIIIDEDGEIGGDPKFIDNDSTQADAPFHWQILQAAPHRHIKVWVDSGTPVIKIVKLANDLDWRPVSSAPNLTPISVKATNNGTLPRIAISETKLYGIEYDDPTGPFPRTKADRSKVLISTLQAENNGDDYIYITMGGNDLVYFQKKPDD